MKSALFVWLQGQRGPVPQVWHASVKREKFDRAILAKHELKPEQEWLDIGVLASFFPAPEVK
jgi:hypothetical protein